MCTHDDKGWLIPTTILYKDRGNRKVPGCRCLKMKMGCLCSWYPGNGSRHQFVSISIKDVPTTPLYTYRSNMENGTTSSHNPSSAEVLEGRTIKTTPTCNAAWISHCLNLSSLVFYHSVAVLVHELHSDSKCEN